MPACCWRPRTRTTSVTWPRANSWGGDNPIATLDLAYFEVANVAVRAWNDLAAADRLLARVAAIDEDGGVVRADVALLAVAAGIAAEHGISVYDAAYVAAAGERSCRLVSCDVRDLVSRGLATAPAAGA